MLATAQFPIPIPTPETQPFWDATARGVLLLHQCVKDGTTFSYYRAAPFCPTCHGDEIRGIESAGTGFVYSFVINQRTIPGVSDASAVIALIELDEGPRIVGRVLEVDPTPEAVHLGLQVEVGFHSAGDYQIPFFRPRKDS